ncbi:MAG: hypothetical protein J0L70_07235 [Leptolyngbya sp. UWPOB_LEPTO1]|uniref:hypothetical protein n=1 Tax=Leptolyngbya sp. UWPOB_LEPTO1 TaxID=2815653 RepID=UPI001ACE69B6|nr:hypothetical protein [Leptolyngbya sp. UWPOB_LEPTO1]MBN8560297.1 hypothetical protein [Leptolyngbya sp. UWPOB_LEPTO1]
MVNPLDPYEQLLFATYTEAEALEIEALLADWDQATYETLAHSIVDHAERHGYSGNYLRYLRKAKNFNKKSAKQKTLADGAIRWNKGFEFLIERSGKIISYGEN